MHTLRCSAFEPWVGEYCDNCVTEEEKDVGYIAKFPHTPSEWKRKCESTQAAYKKVRNHATRLDRFPRHLLLHYFGDETTEGRAEIQALLDECDDEMSFKAKKEYANEALALKHRMPKYESDEES